MRILGLCLLLFVCVAMLCPTMPAQAQSPNQNQTAAKTDSSGTWNVRPGSGLHFLKPDRDGVLVLKPDWDGILAAEGFCAYMRTYRVKREYRNSDEVRPAGYTTCVPSKRFEVRSAVEVHAEPAPQK